MFIKFANTLGDVFEGTMLVDQYNIGAQTLGEVLTYDDGIIIVDRMPKQVVSQLDMSELIAILRQLLQKSYALQTGDVEVHLPRMFVNINEQARCQAQFQHLSSKIDYTCNSEICENIFNIKLIHV